MGGGGYFLGSPPLASAEGIISLCGPPGARFYAAAALVLLSAVPVIEFFMRAAVHAARRCAGLANGLRSIFDAPWRLLVALRE